MKSVVSLFQKVFFLSKKNRAYENSHHVECSCDENRKVCVYEEEPPGRFSSNRIWKKPLLSPPQIFLFSYVVLFLPTHPHSLIAATRCRHYINMGMCALYVPNVNCYRCQEQVHAQCDSQNSSLLSYSTVSPHYRIKSVR